MANVIMQMYSCFKAFAWFFTVFYICWKLRHFSSKYKSIKMAYFSKKLESPWWKEKKSSASSNNTNAVSENWRVGPKGL